MAAWFRKDKVPEPDQHQRSGGWYADPYGVGARRWYDSKDGWSDRVEGIGEQPDKTGVSRLDEAAGRASSNGSGEQAREDDA
jgi:hypothetical protein